MWEITDDKGVIHAGSEEEMRKAFAVMKSDDVTGIQEMYSLSYEEAHKLVDDYSTEWTGDLKLVQVHEIYR